MRAEPDGAGAPGTAAGSPDVQRPVAEELGFSLVSHTNVGKTTLARTLLRRDIGDVLDQAHVTDESGRHTLIEADGARLVLWDTPGFGDSVRFLGLLSEHERPLEWALAQSFDRDADRPLWCSQAALRNVLEHGDLVLYLVNASEDPADAGYVQPEMELLEKLGKPVLLVLNQTGPPREPRVEQDEVERWTRHLTGRSIVRGVLPLDAFARCWVQEGLLLERAREILPPERRPLCQRLLEAWRARQLEVLSGSAVVLASELARAALDQETIEEGGWGNDKKRAMALLRDRMVLGVQHALSKLISLHGLEGRAAVELETALSDFSLSARDLDPKLASVVGATAGGVAGGVLVDLAVGGLSGFLGAILGGAAGLKSGREVARAYRFVSGGKRPTVFWSEPLLERTARELLMRYLAVAHFGRGRGAWRDREPPRHWREELERALDARRPALRAVLRSARDPDAVLEPLRARLAPLLRAAARDTLAALYPGCEAWLTD